MFIHKCIMISLIQLITEYMCSVAFITRVHNLTLTHIYKNLLDLAWLNTMANFCQQVLKPLGSYTQCVLFI